jgi:hypothetical protein
MPVEKPDVVDFVVQHPKTQAVMLVMVETRDWTTSILSPLGLSRSEEEASQVLRQPQIEAPQGFLKAIRTHIPESSLASTAKTVKKMPTFG